jgi:hypothetical protein
MATFNIISPKFSFVNFNPQGSVDNCCIGEKEVCLPVVEDNDLVFQFSIVTDTIQDATDVFNSPLSGIQLLLLDVDGNEVHNWTVADNLLFEKYRTGPNKISYLWRNTLQQLTPNDIAASHLECDQCFSFKIIATATVNSEVVTKTAFSNCFVVRCKDCYTTIFEYYNNETYADFEYCNITNPINKVRLFVHLNQPKSIEDKAVYRKSNGVIRQTRSLITKEYQAQTEHFPETIHDKIVIMLAHDTVQVTSSSYTGGVSKNGEYEIEWIDNLCKAPAKFKATATPFAIRNNNCAECTDLILCSEISGINGFVNYDFNTNQWSVDVHSISWLSAITIGGLISVKFSYRQGGTIGAFTDLITVQINHLGQVINPPTNLVNTGSLDENWTSVEVRATVLCELQSNNNNFIKAFYNPANSTCAIVTNISVVAGSTFAIVTFIEPSPAPSLGYDWTLHELSGGVSDFGSINAGTDTINLNNLLSSTDYFIVIVSKCGVGNNSQPVSHNFSTTI